MNNRLTAQAQYELYLTRKEEPSALKLLFHATRNGNKSGYFLAQKKLFESLDLLQARGIVSGNTSKLRQALQERVDEFEAASKKDKLAILERGTQLPIKVAIKAKRTPKEPRKPKGLVVRSRKLGRSGCISTTISPR